MNNLPKGYTPAEAKADLQALLRYKERLKEFKKAVLKRRVSK